MTNGTVDKADAEGPGLRARHRQRTRRALEDAALALFAERGYDQTSVEAIAERAEVSARTFFRYFTTKEDVILDQWGDRPWRYRDLVVARPTAEPLLVALREAYAEFVAHDEDGARQRMFLRNRVIQATPLLRGHGMVRIGAEWREAIADAVAQRSGAVEQGPEHTMLASLVMVPISSATAQWVDGEGRDPFEELARRAFDLLGTSAAALASPH